MERMEGLDKPDFLITAEGSDIFALPPSAEDEETPDISGGEKVQASSLADAGEEGNEASRSLLPGTQGRTPEEEEGAQGTVPIPDTDCGKGLANFLPHVALESSAADGKAETEQDGKAETEQDASLPSGSARAEAEAKQGPENSELWENCNPGLMGSRIPSPTLGFPLDAPEIPAAEEEVACRDVMLLPPGLGPAQSPWPVIPLTPPMATASGLLGYMAHTTSRSAFREGDYGDSPGVSEPSGPGRLGGANSRRMCTQEEDDSVSTFIMADDGGNPMTITDGDRATDDEEATTQNNQGTLQSKAFSNAAGIFGKLTDVKWLMGSTSDAEGAARGASTPYQSAGARYRGQSRDNIRSLGASGGGSFGGLWGRASDERASMGVGGTVGGSSGTGSSIFGLTLSSGPTESQLCSICFEHEKNAVFLGCGHSSICYSCAIDTYVNNREKCPFCRQRIDQVLIIGEVAILHAPASACPPPT